MDIFSYSRVQFSVLAQVSLPFICSSCLRRCNLKNKMYGTFPVNEAILIILFFFFCKDRKTLEDSFYCFRSNLHLQITLCWSAVRAHDSIKLYDEREANIGLKADDSYRLGAASYSLYLEQEDIYLFLRLYLQHEQFSLFCWSKHVKSSQRRGQL